MKRSLTLTALLLAMFFAAALFIPADTMKEPLSAAVFILAGIAVMRWGPAGWRLYFSGASTAPSWGILGVVLFMVAEAAANLYTLIFLTLDRPDYMQVLHVSPFISYVKLVAMGLFIAATNFEGERPSRVGAAAGATLAAFGLLLTALGPIAAARGVGVVELVWRAFFSIR